ncbi:DUF192 domain-containing protein [Jannaschia sp. W003]|uniref:DUF192 domain-containing protein n=1 Tax=Jannaschia sp. W003 TaxID=2867012 RepID=UPI0021A9077F|nr:DUF192 domain-containing protein [Jannaschia sp. W003]UWQ20448.1 DUF192 domain-containing protein [Jannaschia sp. W003]
MGIRPGALRGAALAGLLLGLLSQAAAAGGCRADRVDLRGDFGTASFATELALSPEDQARGLMFRESMPSMAGMLFVYDREQPVAFWMRNTLIPLDMIFVDESGTVTKVHAEAVPGDETPIPSGDPARAVLEINGGMAERLGIEAGDELRSPVMPQDAAAWPCADASQ